MIMCIYLVTIGGIFALISAITGYAMATYDKDDIQVIDIKEFIFLKPIILIPAFINVLCIYLMDYFENKIALFMTHLENLKTYKEFINSFILKR